MVVVGNLAVKILGDASGGVLNEGVLLELEVLVELNRQLERDNLEWAKAVEESRELSGRLFFFLGNNSADFWNVSRTVLPLEVEHLLQLGLQQMLARESEVTRRFGLQAVATDGVRHVFVEGSHQTLPELVRDLEKMAALQKPMVRFLIPEELLQVAAVRAPIRAKSRHLGGTGLS